MEKHFIRVLPFYSQPVVGDPQVEPLMPVALWKCAENICEGAEPGSPCDDSEGHYYTIAGDEVTYWCPLHWYKLHFVHHAGQRLVEMDAEHYEQERDAHKQHIQQRWRSADEYIVRAARSLESCGLIEEAGRLYEARGSIRSRITSR